MIIRAPHPNITEPQTYLTASAAAAATALTVANTSGLVANDYTVIGRPGQEAATIKKISTVTSVTALAYVGDAIDFAISVNTPVTYVKYNQVKFYLGDWSARYETGTVAISKGTRTLTGTGTAWGTLDTTYALLLNGKWYDIYSVAATSIVLTEDYTDEDLTGSSYALVGFTSQKTSDLTIDQEFTIWDDTDALAEDYYRTEYYNETTAAASTKSSIISADETDGFSDFALRSIEDEVLTELRDKNAKRRSRAEIDVDVNNAIRSLTNVVVSDIQEDYLNTYDTISLVADRGEYPLFDDFRKLTSVWVSYDGSDYKKATPMRISDDLPDVDYSESEPRYYLRDNVIGVKPLPTAAATDGIKVWYDRRIPSLTNEGDELPFIFRDFKRAVVAYALHKAWLADGNDQRAAGYNLEFMDAKREMINVLEDRDMDATKTVEIVNDQDLYE